MITEVSHKLGIAIILTIGFALASLFGYFFERIKLSSLFGYLLAGYLIGPYSPGFVADVETAEQLAEIGVILMMFGVGMHFKWEDLVRVKKIAIPGAIGQTLIATLISAILIYLNGWSWESGIIIGLAIGVASTVVLARVLTDNKLLNTSQGHAAVGWLIVEDILTVIALILLPVIAGSLVGKEISLYKTFISIGIALLKFAALVILMFTFGRKLVSIILLKISEQSTQELFTITVFAVIFVIAIGSAYLFGTSIALGAFIAGMVISKTNLRHKASANALPMKDIFVVSFFLSVGMLFNPSAIINYWQLFLIVLGVILIVKPIAAFLIVIFLKYPLKTAITIAVALAQIGEFSFILSEEALRLKILPAQ